MQYLYTAISIKELSPSKAEKSNKLIYLLAIPSKYFALVFDFSALLGDNLNWNSCILISEFITTADGFQ